MPERFEIYIVYKRRYINTLPFLFLFFFLRQTTNPEDVFHAESCVINVRPAGGEGVAERVLDVTTAGVDGDMPVMAGAAQRPDQRPRVALINNDVDVASSTIAHVRL